MMIRDFTFIKRCAPHLRVLSIAALMLGLSGCDWLGILAKETAVAATNHQGWDTFTFKGQLPAEFGIDAIAFYGPNEPGKASCQAQSFEPGKTITRRHAQRYTAEIQAQPQEFSFEIPLSYYKGLCGMRLGRVKLEVNLRYGPQKWQTTYANGNIYIEPFNKERSAQFTPSGTLDIKTKCSIMFQDSKLFGEISKFITCKSSGASLPESTLTNKSVSLLIEVASDEEPFRRNTWIKSPNGWKPCLPKKGWQTCQAPPVFKTFKMNGQICTVYPNCKER
jgi:hypothetical protein